MPRQRGEAATRGGVSCVGVLEDDSNVGIGVIVAAIWDRAGIVNYLHALVSAAHIPNRVGSDRDLKPPK